MLTKVALTTNRLVDQVAPIRRIPIVPGSVGLSVALGLALLSPVLLPLNLLASQRFHHDEALYATWALQIASGRNVWLQQVPLDKPPLFLYTVAGALRLLGPTEAAARAPSLLATAVTVGLTFWLGQKLYNQRVGLLAAWLVALSPFTILFAPTAFTDPMLVTWIMAGCVAASHRRAGWAGLFLGLAVATKQQGVFFVPLALALLLSASRVAGSKVASSRVASSKVVGGLHHASRIPALSPALSEAEGEAEGTPHVLRFAFPLALIVLLTILWDISRHQSPGFWQLSFINYGGLTPANFVEHWREFVELLRYGTASSTLNTIFLVGLPLLLGYDLWQITGLKKSIHSESVTREVFSPAPLPPRSPARIAQTDWILALFVLAFLLGHAWLSFRAWDRYLLGLIPVLALLLARILWLPWSILKSIWPGHRPNLLSSVGVVAGLTLALLLAVTLAGPVQDAANARYPLGSNSGALSGIEQIVAYLQGHVGANSTLYHRWLGTHWRFYLWDYPYDLQYWSSPQALAARAKPGHLIAFPSWRSDTEARLALAAAGLGLQELTRAYTPAGYPSIILYRIVTK